MMNYLKFTAVVLLFGSLYGLVLLGHLDPSMYYTLALSALSALGLHAATTTPYTPPNTDTKNPTQPGPSA